MNEEYYDMLKIWSELVQNIEKDILYLGGGITGVKSFMQKFQEGEERLTNAGFFVLNPTKLPHKDHNNWSQCMRLDVGVIALFCSGIAMLDNFASSRGALIEAKLGSDLQIPVKSVAMWVASRSTDDKDLRCMVP